MFNQVNSVLKPRKIGVITVGRSDFGLYESVLNRIDSDPGMELQLLVTGAHFSTQYGTAVTDIEQKGFPYSRGLDMLLASGSAQGMGKSIGLGVISFAQAFAADPPAILLVLGDRLEMISGPVAALSFNIPIAHCGGGAVTEGAVDEQVRHAITKLSHLHFVFCQQYADRVTQMGEEPWRVFNVGATGLDRIYTSRQISVPELSEQVGLDLSQKTLLVTYHPVTLELNQTEAQVDSLLESLDRSELQVILTYPNADMGSLKIINSFQKYAREHPGRTVVIENAGTEMYLSLMNTVSAMVGNSSSGIVEAPSFKLPVVNIGTRQTGKVRSPNVIDVGYSSDEISKGIDTALSSEFIKELSGMENPYWNGGSAVQIAETLRTIPIDDRLLRKKFIAFPR
jgi:GDP/UDP-N,N'-diacetylbacillosamine 2-epimerase (hydrolysing)